MNAAAFRAGASMLVALLMTACAGTGEDPDVDIGEVRIKATFQDAGRHPGTAGNFHVGACFVTAPGISPSKLELDDIRDIINEWALAHAGLRYHWNTTDPGAMSAITLDGDTYRTACTRNADGTFQEPVRFLIRAPTPIIQTTPPTDRRIPGCTVSELVGSPVYTKDKKNTYCQKKDSAGKPAFDADGKRIWVLCDKSNKPGQYYRVGTALWSMFPNGMYKHTACLYTSNIALGQARNNYLHESGHGLGFQHEQNRDDAVCSPDTAFGIKITGYDRDSVMHYVLHCPDGSKTPGNWGSGGLTREDQLAMEVTYPLWLKPMIHGDLVGVAGSGISARPTWHMQGIRFSGLPGQAVLKNVSWQVNGLAFSTRIQPSAQEWQTLGYGRHRLRLQFDSIWGDHYDGAVVIEMLPTQQAYNRRMAATVAGFF